MSDDNVIICTICLEAEMDVEVAYCLHRFHRQCLTKWIKICVEQGRPFTCPDCSRLLTLEDLGQLVIYFYTNSIDKKQ